MFEILVKGRTGFIPSFCFCTHKVPRFKGLKKNEKSSQTKILHKMESGHEEEKKKGVEEEGVSNKSFQTNHFVLIALKSLEMTGVGALLKPKGLKNCLHLGMCVFLNILSNSP